MPKPKDLVRLAGIGRFQVMALLQAARYYKLKGDLERAMSWGLNRAIFYAWAKYYGKERKRYITLEELEQSARKRRTPLKCPNGMTEVLGECVELGRSGFYSIGGNEQTPREFRRQVIDKISRILKWDDVWRAALEYVSQFPDKVLENPQLFYKLVYEPIRDTFIIELLKGQKPRPPRHVIERIEALYKLTEKTSKKSTLDKFLKKR